MKDKLTLAIDTSGPRSFVAIQIEQGSLIELSTDSVGSHSESLHQLVSDALVEIKKDASDITDCILGRGPGSFTGLRISTAFAQGLSLATGANVYSLCSLKAYAHEFSKTETSPVIAIADARRSEFFVFDTTSKTQEVCILSLDQLSALKEKIEQEYSTAPLICGYGSLDLGEINACEHVASTLIQLLKEGESKAYSGSSLSQIEPHYIREISAKKIAGQLLTKS